MQYFPTGGGGIGPTAPGTGGARTAYPVGANAHGIPGTAARVDAAAAGEAPIPGGGGTDGEEPPGDGGVAGASDWGSV